MFFCFRQIDEYSRPYIFDQRSGITRVVFIQAMSHADALVRAEALGIPSSPDGDWVFQGELDQACYFEPRLSGRTIPEWMESYYFEKMMSPSRPEVYVHMLSGEFHGFIYGTYRNLTLERPQ